MSLTAQDFTNVIMESLVIFQQIDFYNPARMFSDPMTCPEGFKWNDQLEVCDWFDSSSCEEVSGELEKISNESMSSESFEEK